MSAHSRNSSLFRLKASTQQYDWGKLGDVDESLVARFAKGAIGQEYVVDGNKRYAEVCLSQGLVMNI